MNKQTEYRLASRGKRIVGYLFSWLLLCVWVSLVFSITGFITRPMGIDEFQADSIALIALLLSVLIYVSGQLCWMYKYRQTWAKQLFGMQVVDRETKQPLSFGRYLSREVVECLFLFVISIVLLINVIMLLANKDRRTLSDLLFSTCVIEKKA